MEHYDVVIVGAGIAGCGLAHNLKRFGYIGKILVLDKNKIGANAAYGFRNTFQEVIDEYNFNYEKKFDGLNVGTYHKIFSNIKGDFYFVDYKKICNSLISRSDAIFKKERVVSVEDDVLLTGSGIVSTDRDAYTFNFFIDCSGSDFFLKNKMKLRRPYKYWVGKTRSIGDKFSDKFYYHLVDKSGNLEDIYPLKNVILQGLWRYISLGNLYHYKMRKSRFLEKKILSKEGPDEHISIIPCSPAFPFVVGSCASLGDSCGCASTSSGEGIRPILNSSKILAKAIMENNLKEYEKRWKKKYLNVYLRQLASKLNFKIRLKLFRILRTDSDTLLFVMKNNEMPKSAMSKIPKSILIKLLFFYIFLKLKFFIQKA